MFDYRNKTIREILNSIDGEAKRHGKDYLNCGKTQSVKYTEDEWEPNEFEAFIVESSETVLLPGIEVDERMCVQDIHCQCEHQDRLCIHEIALLLVVHDMIERNNMAQKRLIAQNLGSILIQ